MDGRNSDQLMVCRSSNSRSGDLKVGGVSQKSDVLTSLFLSLARFGLLCRGLVGQEQSKAAETPAAHLHIKMFRLGSGWYLL